jgi:hypothetical protein
MDGAFARITIQNKRIIVKETSHKLKGPLQAPDFKQVRKYLKEVSERERLEEFIKAGWSPAELAELARSSYLATGRTYPTALSYQVAVAFGPETTFNKIILAQLRAPGYQMPPFNRPVPPPPIPRDDPDHPDHTPEIRAAVREMALCFKKRRAEREGLPSPDPDAPITRGLWKRCFRLLNRRGSLERALLFEGLLGYRDVPVSA